MATAIREVQATELALILELNNTAGPDIFEVSASQVQWFFEHADYFRVAEVDGQLAGFLIGLTPGAAYTSPNFQWFCARYPDFLYVDRVVVAAPFRGHGIGRVFYADVQSYCEVRHPLLCCEVSLEPRNDAALLFHGTNGFHEVGRQSIQGGTRMVSLLTKDMCSWPFVRDTWLNSPGGLPDLPWLAPRKRRAEPTSRRVAGA